MAITSKEELSELGLIIYTAYKEGRITSTSVNSYVSRGKISADEAAFILG